MKIHTDIQAYCSLHALLDEYLPNERREIGDTIAHKHTWGDCAMSLITGGDFILAVKAAGVELRSPVEVERLDHNCVLIHIDF